MRADHPEYVAKSGTGLRRPGNPCARYLLPLLAGTLLGASLCAQSVEELGVARRSGFAVSNTARNPFWPVGWTPDSGKEVAPKVSSSAWFNEASFRLSSIWTGGLPLAMINGRPYGEGDFISMPGGIVQVNQIRDGVVQLLFEGRTLEVTIRRESTRPPAADHESKIPTQQKH